MTSHRSVTSRFHVCSLIAGFTGSTDVWASMITPLVSALPLSASIRANTPFLRHHFTVYYRFFLSLRTSSLRSPNENLYSPNKRGRRINNTNIIKTTQLQSRQKYLKLDSNLECRLTDASNVSRTRLARRSTVFRHITPAITKTNLKLCGCRFHFRRNMHFKRIYSARVDTVCRK